MPISNSYPKRLPIEDQDLFIGTKAYNNRTVNYSAQSVADYLNINSKVAIGGQMSFQFTTVPNIPKTIAFDGGGGDNTAFSAITKLIVSAIDVSATNITIFLNYLNNSQVLLSQQNQPNFFGHYKITGYTQIGTSDFYELDLEFIGGNGNIGDNQYYDLVSFVLSTEVPPTAWGTIIGNIEDQTDLINYISSQITIPTLQSVTDEGSTTTNTITVGGITSGNFVSDGFNLTVSDSFDTVYNFNYMPFVGLLVGNGTDLYTQLANDGSIAFQTPVGYGNLRSDLVTGSWSWQMPNASGTLALVSDITIPTLDEVLVEGNTSATEIVIGNDFNNGLSLNSQYANLQETLPTHIKQTGFSHDNFYSLFDDLLNGLAYGALLSPTEGLSLQTFGSGGYAKLKSDLLTTVERTIQFPDASGTIALTSDIPTTSGIPHATASGTDTYTATVSGVTAYNDADAYLIRFTNGNTTGATLNINGLGAIPLYRNNDGPLLGGDVADGGEMLCIYNSTTNRFQVIGISPNSLIAYVTNDDSVTITKGMPVYAFSGQGDRMTVKRANNSSDATSAQTVGLVLSTSIATNQKGFIMMQGLLDGLSILPTSTWADGDPVYLGATAGTITNVKPHAPNHLVYLGVVTTASNGSAGRLYVRVQNGYELQELHNVQAQSPSLNDTLWYDNTVSPGQWKTASIPTILGYTPPDLGLVQAMTQGLQNIF